MVAFALGISADTGALELVFDLDSVSAAFALAILFSRSQERLSAKHR